MCGHGLRLSKLTRLIRLPTHNLDPLSLSNAQQILTSRYYLAVLAVTLAACSDPSTTAPTPVTPVRSDTVEARALWVSRFEYSTAASIAAIMADARRANFNIVYLQVRGVADALYRSDVEPCSI
jgi:uncharacterized lipoprotein YddW (UPF0748 family)